MTAFVLKTAKEIGKMVDTAIAHTLKGDALIHAAAVQALGHAARKNDKGVQIGDITLFERLLKGLGKSVRVEGLKVWAQKYSPVAWNGDGKIGLLKTTDKRYRPFDMEAAQANPFWTLAEADEMTRKPLDITGILKVIHGLKGKVERAVKDGKFEGDHAAALNLVENVETFTNGYLASHPIRDGAFDPNDPDNAAPVLPEKAKGRKLKSAEDAVKGVKVTVEGVAPPATTPRRVRRKPTTEQVAA